MSKKLTTNGALTYNSSGNALLDFFFAIGGARTMGDKLLAMFAIAFIANPGMALRALFYMRDPRHGQGQREAFRNILKWLAINEPKIVMANICVIPVYGRWDDLFALRDTACWDGALRQIANALSDGNALCAKWMPREKSKRYPGIAREIRRHLGLSLKEYRKLLTRLTTVVEQPMCAGTWDQIDYSGVPSRAMSIYSKAFGRRDTERFGAWKAALVKEVGTDTVAAAKVNAGAIYPHEIMAKLLHDAEHPDMLQAMWAALPDYTNGKKFMVMVDGSGSMFNTPGIAPGEIAIALAIYMAERQIGPLANSFLTFSMRPQLINLPPRLTVKEKAQICLRYTEVANTNLVAAFELMLKIAISSKAKPSEMPETVLVLTDMEFDQGTSLDLTTFEAIRARYADAGYACPNIVFWNLAGTSSVPVKFNQAGAALVSGFSPSLLQGITSGEISPAKIMENILLQKHYDGVVLPP